MLKLLAVLLLGLFAYSYHSPWGRFWFYQGQQKQQIIEASNREKLLTPISLAQCLAMALATGADLGQGFSLLAGQKIALRSERYMDCDEINQGLQMGLSWDQIWVTEKPDFSQLGKILHHHLVTGGDVTEKLVSWAEDHDVQAQQETKVQVGKLTVLLLLPVGLCLLPAFICIAIIPMILSGLF